MGYRQIFGRSVPGLRRLRGRSWGTYNPSVRDRLFAGAHKSASSADESWAQREGVIRSSSNAFGRPRFNSLRLPLRPRRLGGERVVHQIHRRGAEPAEISAEGQAACGYIGCS
jgi:hypothetical protein